MPVATTHTEPSIAALAHADLSDVGLALGWTADGVTIGSYQHVVNRTLRAYGAAVIADATDLEKLEALAIWQAWRAAVRALTTRYDISTDGQSLARSQMIAHARVNLIEARKAAFAHDPDYQVSVQTLRYTQDIYAPVDDDEEE